MALAPLQPSERQSSPFHVPQGFNEGKYIEWCYSMSDDAFINRGHTNWKDTSGDKKDWFPLHEWSHYHRHCMGILAQSHHDIANMMSTEHVVFLAKQRLSFRGNWVPAEKEGEQEQR